MLTRAGYSSRNSSDGLGRHSSGSPTAKLGLGALQAAGTAGALWSQDPEDPKDVEVIKIEINACKNGEKFPECGMIVIDIHPPREPMEMGTIPVRAILRGLRGLFRRIRGIRPVRSLKDVKSLPGASKKEIEDLVPKDWVRSPSATGGGVRYADPRHLGDQVRIMPGNPGVQELIKQGPYAVITRSGIRYRIPLKGNPTLP